MQGTYEAAWLHSPKTLEHAHWKEWFYPLMLLKFKSGIRAGFEHCYYDKFLFFMCLFFLNLSSLILIFEFFSKLKRILRLGGHGILCNSVSQWLGTETGDHYFQATMWFCVNKTKPLARPQGRLLIMLSWFKMRFNEEHLNLIAAYLELCFVHSSASSLLPLEYGKCQNKEYLFHLILGNSEMKYQNQFIQSSGS